MSTHDTASWTCWCGHKVEAEAVVDETFLPRVEAHEFMHPPREETGYRRFELTISVWAAEPPDTFRDWIDLAFGTEGLDLPATPTTLERVVETRHPPAKDIVARRKAEGERARRSGGWRLY